MTTCYTLTCLSPLHIGTGNTWTRLDGAYENGRWYVVDLDAVFAQGIDGDELAQAMNAQGFTWASWLKGRGLRAEQVALYSLPCPQDPREVPIREGVKDIYAKPYIPGSTLKGAIRTAILWHLLTNSKDARTFTERYLVLAVYSKDIASELRRQARGDRNQERDWRLQQKAIRHALQLDTDQEAEEFLTLLYRLKNKNPQEARRGGGRQQLESRDIERLGNNKHFVGLPIERYLLGEDPNHDLLRVVRVIDSQPVSLDAMEVGLVWTYTIRNGKAVQKREQEGEYKAFSEWLKPGASLQTRVEIDNYLLDKAQQELKCSSSAIQAVRQLAQVCNAYAQALAKREKAFADNYLLDPFRKFYADLLNRLGNLPPGAFVLNIGWGGGWDAKTVGDLLEDMLEEGDFEELRDKYQLGAKPGSKQIDWNSPFPKTRLVAYREGVPSAPLGWVLLAPQSVP